MVISKVYHMVAYLLRVSVLSYGKTLYLGNICTVIFSVHFTPRTANTLTSLCHHALPIHLRHNGTIEIAYD